MSVVFCSADGRFRVELGDTPLETILEGGRKSFPVETGGILIGYYTGSLRTAVIEDATLPAPDSRRTRTSFYRGVVGLKERLQRLWRRPRPKRRYYLGEWHMHPGGPPVPSGPDRAQMQQIAESEDYHCPEVVLLLLGGDPGGSYSIAAWIFRADRPPIRLRANARDLSPLPEQSPS